MSRRAIGTEWRDTESRRLDDAHLTLVGSDKIGRSGPGFHRTAATRRIRLDVSRGAQRNRYPWARGRYSPQQPRGRPGSKGLPANVVKDVHVHRLRSRGDSSSRLGCDLLRRMRRRRMDSVAVQCRLK